MLPLKNPLAFFKPMPSLPLRRREKGLALVELIITLGIGSLIALSVWVAFADRKVISTGATHAFAVTDLMDMADRSYASSIGFSTGTGTAALPVSLDRLAASAQNDLPAGVSVSGAAYENNFGGGWTVTAESTNGGATLDLVRVETTNIPRGQCRVMLQQVSPYVYDTRVNGNLVGLERTAGNSTLTTRNSLNFTQALPLCQATNTMSFRRMKSIRLTDLRRIQPFPSTLTEEEQGLRPSFSYQESYQYHYDRVQAALATRESEQAALSP